MGPSPLALIAIQETKTQIGHYPDPIGQQLCEIIAQQNGRTPAEVVLGNGSEAIINNLFTAFFSSGDELLTSEGTFVAVYIWAKAHNVTVRKVPLTGGYAYDLDAMRRAITPKTRMVYIATPNNPTGTIIHLSEIKAFISELPDNVIAVVDEAYFEYARFSTSEFPDTAKWSEPRTITLRTFSKAYGLAGLRIGYAIAPCFFADALRKVKLTFEPGGLAQSAALSALKDTAFLNEVLELNARSHSEYTIACQRIGIEVVPSFGNFLMLVLHDVAEAETLTEFLMGKGVFVRRLQAFGLPHCVRITTGLDHENRRCIEGLIEFYER